MTPSEAADALRPFHPWGLSTVAGDRSVTLNWNAPQVDESHAAASTYRVQRSYDAVNWTTFAWVLGSQRSLVVPDLQNGRTYYLRVIAVNSYGVSDPSWWTRATPQGPAGSCSRVAVVGDSLTYASQGSLRAEFAAIGQPVIIDGVSSRRVPTEAGRPYSGVYAVQDIRASYGDVDCWVVALGTNDLYWIQHPGGYGSTPTSTAQNYLTWMRQAVNANGVPHQIWWVNVNSGKFPWSSVTFNGVLDQQPDIVPIDFYTPSAANSSWFDSDRVHLTPTGYRARSLLIARAMP